MNQWQKVESFDIDMPANKYHLVLECGHTVTEPIRCQPRTKYHAEIDHPKRKRCKQCGPLE